VWNEGRNARKSSENPKGGGWKMKKQKRPMDKCNKTALCSSEAIEN
jgi:hypothetical protein